jgi:ABC-type glycerol-3-phosphate transport system substrate-binding protein
MTPAQMAPLPIGAEGVKSADLSITGFHVSANSLNPQACIKLINYLSNQSAVFSYGGIPARTSAAKSAVFEQTNAYLVPLRDTMQQTLEQPASYNGNPNSFYMFEGYWLNEALDMILTKKADATLELTKAQDKTNAYLACAAGVDPNTGSLLECAEQVDPNYKGYLTDQNPVPMFGTSRTP